MTDIQDWDVVDADNNAASPAGAPENMARSGVNNTIRAMMGAIRRDFDGSAPGGGPWRDANESNTLTRINNTTIEIAVIDATGWFPVGRKVRINYSDEPGNNPGYAYVASSSFVGGGPTTVVLERFDGQAPDNVVRAGPSITALSFYAGFGGRDNSEISRAAFMDFDGYVVPTALTAAGINAAITEASAKNKIVFLEEATYVLEAKVSITTGVHVRGMGVGRTILQAGVALDDTMVEFPNLATDCELSDVELDGNAANQASGIGINFTTNTVRCKVRDVYLHDIWGIGIEQANTANSGTEMVLENITILNTGNDAIHLDYNALGFFEAFMHNIHITAPGTGGEGSLLANGIGGQGIAIQASNIWIDMGAAAGNLGAAISYQNVIAGAGRGSSFSNFSINMSTAAAARAISLTGSVHLSDGYIYGFGKAGGAIDDGYISDVMFHQCEPGLDVDGETVVKGCIFLDSPVSTQALSVNATATRVVLMGNTFWDCDADGILVSAGAVDTIIKDNIFETIGGDCIVIAATANDTLLDGNIYDNVTGVEVNDSGGRTGIAPMAFHPGNDSGTIGTAETSAGGARRYPLPPNGRRRFLVECRAVLDVGSGANTIDIHFYSGATGGVGESVITDQVTGVGAQNDYQMRIAQQIYTPAAGDFFGFGIQFSVGAANRIRPNGYKSGAGINPEGESWVKVTYLDG